MKHNYLQTELGHRFLTQIPWLSAQLPKYKPGDVSELEITRLIENHHYSNIKDLLQLIAYIGDSMGEISTRLLKSKDTIEFSRAIAELLMFNHLRSFNGERVTVIPCSTGRTADFAIDHQNGEFTQKFVIELYSPIDNFGHHTFERNVLIIVKNLTVPFGFEVRVETRSDNFYYPYDFPEFKDVESWLDQWRQNVASWISSASVGDIFNQSTPWSDLSVSISLDRLHTERNIRIISQGSSTRSTDTILYFRMDEVSAFLSSQWGIKLLDKLDKRQAGNPEEGVARILLVDFSLSDTCDYQLLAEQPTATRIEGYFKAMCKQLADPLPYDIVVPCAVGGRCGFGKAVFLDSLIADNVKAQLDKAGLTRPFQVVPEATQEEIDVLMQEMLSFS